MKRGKNYKKSMEAYDREQAYSIDEAMGILEKFPKAKFDETLEVHVRTSIDPRKSDQQVRGAVVLPHGTGKTLKIAAFTSTQEKDAKSSGADIVGGEELIEKIKSGTATIDFEVAVATPEMMPKLAKIAKILGPKGLMPNPKTQTVGPKIAPLVEALKKGRLNFKNDDTGNVHQIIGKRSFDTQKLKENFEAFMDEMKKTKPAAVKGKFITNITLAATMTAGIKIKL